MAQPPVAGPFRELDLADQPRLDPVRGPASRRIDEGRIAALDRAQALREVGERCTVESGADTTGVVELAALVMDADQQRPESLTGAGRLGVAADHELLAAAALHLEP